MASPHVLIWSRVNVSRRVESLKDTDFLNKYKSMRWKLSVPFSIWRIYCYVPQDQCSCETNTSSNGWFLFMLKARLIHEFSAHYFTDFKAASILLPELHKFRFLPDVNCINVTKIFIFYYLIHVAMKYLCMAPLFLRHKILSKILPMFG